MTKAFSDLEIVLVLVARNISRFVLRDTARTFSRFSQHEPRHNSRFFTCAQFFSFKWEHHCDHDILDSSKVPCSYLQGAIIC